MLLRTGKRLEANFFLLTIEFLSFGIIIGNYTIIVLSCNFWTKDTWFALCIYALEGVTGGVTSIFCVCTSYKLAGYTEDLYAFCDEVEHSTSGVVQHKKKESSPELFPSPSLLHKKKGLHLPSNPESGRILQMSQRNQDHRNKLTSSGTVCSCLL